jgi:hypothetical protein
MTRRGPRFRLVYAVVQVPGVVAIVDAVVASALVLLAATRIGAPFGLVVVAAVGTFLVVAAILLVGWQRSMAELEDSLTPLFPTPPDALDRPVGDAGRL